MIARLFDRRLRHAYARLVGIPLLAIASFSAHAYPGGAPVCEVDFVTMTANMTASLIASPGGWSLQAPSTWSPGVPVNVSVVQTDPNRKFRGLLLWSSTAGAGGLGTWAGSADFQSSVCPWSLTHNNPFAKSQQPFTFNPPPAGAGPITFHAFVVEDCSLVSPGCRNRWVQVGNLLLAEAVGNTVPDRFSFAAVVNVAPGSVVTSSAVTITGIAAPAPISVTGGQYSIGCGSVFTTSPGTIGSGQSVCVRHTSAAAAGTAVTTLLSVGGVSATFASTTAGGKPNYTALWWNPAESGWGINLNEQGDIIFATLFTYDATGAPLWLVMSAGTLQTDGSTYSGDLYRTTGSAFNAEPFVPLSSANVTKVGLMSLRFAGPNSASLTYSFNGTTVNKSIEKQVFASRPAACLSSTSSDRSFANYQDLWWNPAESGWGLNITHQDDTLFATLFTYDATGRGLWLVMSGGAKQADGSYFGDLFQTRGSPFDAQPFRPLSGADVTKVGTLRLSFADGNSGALAYSVNGVSVRKNIVRQEFSSSLFACY